LDTGFKTGFISFEVPKVSRRQERQVHFR